MEQSSLNISSTEESRYICFNKEEFMNDNFSVDSFVSKLRKNVSLESLQKDLTFYLKILKSSMVELINHDYADFLNLSSNLAGLDKAIGNLCIPLGQLREEVMSVKSALDESLVTAKMLIDYQQDVRSNKLILQHIMILVQGFDQLERLYKTSPLHNIENSNIQTEIMVERIANEIVQVEFHLNRLPKLPIVEQLKPGIDRIAVSLQRYLEDLFLTSLDNNNVNKLNLVLRICLLIGYSKNIQILFKTNVVHPYMIDVICEKNLNQEKGIEKIYADVLQFIPMKCKEVAEATSPFSNPNSKIDGYNFLVDVVWEDVVNCIETKIAVIFSPGSPERFHQNYLSTLHFIDQFEEFCPDSQSVERLRKSPSYQSFHKKWNLPVYFQIMFTRIAGGLEAGFNQDLESGKEGSEFCLEATSCLMSSLALCWSKDIYLAPLSHRFWKLTLQCISRYATWASDQIKMGPRKITENNEGISGGKPKGHSLEEFIMLLRDILNLQTKIPIFFKEIVYPAFETAGFDQTEILKIGAQECIVQLQQLPTELDIVVVGNLSRQCAGYLKSATDIPKLYRKTNREVPSKPSLFIANLFTPLENCIASNKKEMASSRISSWTKAVVEIVTEQYLTIIRDVLHQVKRIEDSLKILKKAREKTSTDTSSGLNDNDKIRLQISIDIENYGKKIKSLGIQTCFPIFAELVELVESARSSPAT